MSEEQENAEVQNEAVEQTAQEQPAIAALNPEEQQQKNFEYLRDQVFYAGFGYEHESELMEGIRSGKETFEIPHITHFGEDYMSANLNFSKSEKTGNYFFNSFDALLSKVDQHETLNHRFYRDNKVTLKEAYNLLSGRAVHKTGLETKEGRKYDSWIQLDLTQKNVKDNYLEKKFNASGFDLKDALNGYPIKEIDPTNKNHEVNMSNMIDSLKKGNLQTVTFTIVGEDCKRQISANPRFHNINLHDQNGQRLGQRSDQSQNNQQRESQGKSENQGKKQQASPGDDEAPEVSSPSRRKSRKVGS